MSTVKEVIDAYRDLSLTDRLAFYSTLTGQLTASSEERQEFMMQTRHSDGIRCAFCQADHIVKNGKRRDGTQRYLCRECGRSFLATTDSVISGTRKKLAVWKKYLHCMTEKKTLKNPKRKPYCLLQHWQNRTVCGAVRFRSVPQFLSPIWG